MTSASVSPIDLRSDTVTKPTPGMRRAIAEAPVGDDQFGEDPSVNALQERCAALLGKEAALWLPTGTMANQVVLRTLTRPGDDVIVSRASHALWHEAGAAAVNAGVQLTEIGSGGVFTVDEFRAARRPRGHMLYPPTTLVEIENTHNRMGGVVVPQPLVDDVCAAAREDGIASFLDGARLWNASAATGLPPATLAAPADVVAVSFSKGLGAPAGALVAGTQAFVSAALRSRRTLGGAMRQVGLLAAAASYALDHHLGRLADDHAAAQVLARGLSAVPGIEIDLTTVQTNIVLFHLAPGAPDAATFVAAARAAGVLLIPFGPRTVRAVTHLDVTTEECGRAVGAIADLLRF